MQFDRHYFHNCIHFKEKNQISVSFRSNPIEYIYIYILDLCKMTFVEIKNV